jgi:tripartite-type tricarboxylate transporter receptor subunit TctC
MPPALIADNLAKAPPDGYTVGIGGSVLWLTPLTQKTSYDAIKDFAPITWTTTNPYMLAVHPSVPVKSAKELIGLAKAKPGILNIAAASGSGSESFLAAELFKAMAGVNMVRISYKSAASAVIAVIAGDVESMIVAPNVVLPNVKAGKLRALAVTSLEPSPLAPGLPTLNASGVPGYEMIAIQGWLAPGKTPAAIVNRLNQEMVRAIMRPEIKERLLNNGNDVVGDTPSHFAAKINSEIVKWVKVLKDAGVKTEL